MSELVYYRQFNIKQLNKIKNFIINKMDQSQGINDITWRNILDASGYKDNKRKFTDFGINNYDDFFSELNIQELRGKITEEWFLQQQK